MQHNNHNNYGFNCLNNAFVCFKLKRWTLDTVVVVAALSYCAVVVAVAAAEGERVELECESACYGGRARNVV